MTVLVVDDDPDLRETLCDVLTDEGFVVASARNGMEALATLQAHQRGVCLILLDVMMPVMSGVEFRERQRSDPQLAGIPVVVMSARWETRDVFQGLEFLRKPMRLEEVLSLVRRNCAARSEPPCGA